MADNVLLIDPRKLERNPDNPRLIFHQDELDALQGSIEKQGILVPLTVYQDKRKYFILDGERRWRCSVKLALGKVPVIIQPKPDRLQNIMMMFAIHNARRDWDPLPTAYKLQELETEWEARQGRRPTETELAEMASIARGEVRRLKKLLALPKEYRDELMDELAKPRADQRITVDHVLEVTNAARSLRKRDVINEHEEDNLRKALLDKYRDQTEKNTVEPRKLARIARAVERGEIQTSVARRVTKNLINDHEYTIKRAFASSVEQVDFEHSLELLVERLVNKLEDHLQEGYEPGEGLQAALSKLRSLLRRF